MTERPTRIQLCGRLVATVAGRRVEGDLPGRQGRLLFVYLVLNRRQPVPRGLLLEALWPGALPDGAESALSALLSKLRRTLVGTSVEGRGEVRLALPDDAWVDLEAAAEALHRAEAALAREDWVAAWGPGRVAQHIAARGFLPAEAAPWVEDVRRRLERLYERALEIAALASLRIGGSELDTAERTARTLIAVGPYGETGHRVLMQTLAARGDRARALLVYDEFRRRLRDDLGAAPSRETQDLHRDLLG